MQDKNASDKKRKGKYEHIFTAFEILHVVADVVGYPDSKVIYEELAESAESHEETDDPDSKTLDAYCSFVHELLSLGVKEYMKQNPSQ